MSVDEARREPVIRVEGLSKLYRRVQPGAHLRTLKSALLQGNLTQGLSEAEIIEALDGVSFEVAAGEAFGLIGGNGSGKSTLLKVVAGILKPSRGSVVVDGRLAALIELGAGFHPEISGRENIFINGAVLGLSRREVESRFDDIVAFSGLEDFIHEPVKNYSSGMYVRLGFAVAVHTDPDVLLVDEVLAVGDEAFAHRCLRRIQELLANGKTLLFVSHSLDLVESLCDRVLWLDRGRQRMVGEPRRVVDAYRQAVAQDEAEEHRRQKDARDDGQPSEEESAESLRWGSREAEIHSVRLLRREAAAGDWREAFVFQSGEEVLFEIRLKAPRPLNDFAVGIALSTPRGLECWGTNTDLEGFEPELLEGEATVRLRCPHLRLAPGEYRLDVAVHARNGAPYDYRKKVLSFTVSAPHRGVGVYFPEHSWAFEGGIQLVREERSGEG